MNKKNNSNEIIEEHERVQTEKYSSNEHKNSSN